MIDLTYDLDSAELRRALRRMPDALMEHLGKAVHRGAIEVERGMRREAPKAHSTLTQSIRAVRTGVLEYTIAPHVNYDVMAASKTGVQRVPPFTALYDWVRVRRIRPRTPGMDVVDLTWLIMRAISRKGTPENDFAGRTADTHRDRVRELAHEAVRQAIRGAGLNG